MTDEEYMSIALCLAEEAFNNGEVPVGALIVKDGVIIGKGYNEREKKTDVSSHAEIEAIKEAALRIGDWRLDGASMFVTLEPCLMCSGAILQARIGRLVYGADDERMGAVMSNYRVFDEPGALKRPLISTGVLKEECEALLKKFFSNRRKQTSFDEP